MEGHGDIDLLMERIKEKCLQDDEFYEGFLLIYSLLRLA